MELNSVVAIKWLDISHCEDDMPISEVKNLQPEVMLTWGQLLLDESDRIVVASTKAGQEYRCLTTIPKGVLVKITNLKEEENEEI